MAHAPRPTPLFLRPASYRRRRQRDAARMLPFVGIFLMLLPLLWAPQDTSQRDTAPDGIYLFVIWALLIVCAMLISRALAAPGDADDPEQGADQDSRQ
ncbi:MAG: hypothetical protein MUC82_16165 [Cypionkella sp.]|jgi:hypothetical protein|nr:hypothetical protein [Cypionkella sp.]